MVLLLTYLLTGLAGLAAAIAGSSSASSASPSPTVTPTHCTLNGQLPSPTPSDFHFSGNVRTYYVAAEEVDWDYAPSGWDIWLSVPVKNYSPRADAGDYNDFSIGTKWRKAVYRGYKDASFSQRSVHPPDRVCRARRIARKSAIWSRFCLLTGCRRTTHRCTR